MVQFFYQFCLMTRWFFIFLDKLFTAILLIILFLGCLVSDLLSSMILLQTCKYDLSSELIFLIVLFCNDRVEFKSIVKDIHFASGERCC